MDQQLEALRRRIKKTSRNARGYRRYDEQLRVEIMEYVLRRESDGCCQAEAARELGLTQRTVWGWAQRTQQGLLKPVEIIDDERGSSSRGRTLVLPGGAKIEGLSIDDVLVLVRAHP